MIEGLATSVIVATRTAFTVGDQIEVDGVVGEIERVANRSTVLRTRDGKRVHIPNSELIDKTVIVYTAYEKRRSSIDAAVRRHKLAFEQSGVRFAPATSMRIDQTPK